MTSAFRPTASLASLLWHSSLSFIPSALLLLVSLLAFSAHAESWPSVPLPRGLNTFDIGQQVSVNGLPMHLRGFVSATDSRELAEAFRQSLGKPLVENLFGSKLVLGRLEAEHYLSVQIESAGSGSRGILAVTHLKAAYDNQATTRDNTQRWLTRLPAGSQLLSQMESQDAGKLSRHLVITNTQDESLNRDRLIGILADEGLKLEREGRPSTNTPKPMPEGLAASRMLFFKGTDKDAIATVRRDGNGQTTVVLNIVTSLERMR